MAQVGVLEARNNLSALIKRACDGEEIVIASRGRAQVRLTQVEPPAPHGSGIAISQWLDSRPPRTGRIYTAAEIDAQIRTERQAWE